MIGWLMKLGFKAAPLAAIGYMLQDGGQLSQQVDQVTSMFKVAQVQIELNFMRDDLRSTFELNGKLPDPSDFGAYLQQNFKSKASARDVSKDAWETPYVLESISDGFAIRSCGRDKQCQTKDDVTVRFVGLEKLRKSSAFY